MRILLDIVDEVTAAIGPDRVGVRLSPFGQYGGVRDSNPLELFTFVIHELDSRRISYLHLIEAKGSEMGLTDELHEDAVNNAALFREVFHGPLLSAAAYTPASAALSIEKNHADAIAFGRLFIANPDLERANRLTPSTGRPSTAAENMGTQTIRLLDNNHCRLQFNAEHCAAKPNG